jgi:hypothetical protein
MAQTLLEQSTRAASGEYRAIVDALIARELPGIMAEPANTPGHANRINLAQHLVRPGGLGSYGEIFYRLVAANINIRSVDDMTTITEGAWVATFAAVYETICGNTVL